MLGSINFLSWSSIEMNAIWETLIKKKKGIRFYDTENSTI